MIQILTWGKFPVSKVRQVAKKLESSKPTAKHIKQVSSEPQATQVNLFIKISKKRITTSKSQRKQRKSFKSRQANHKYQQEDKQDERKPQIHRKFQHVHASPEDRFSKCGDTPHIEGFRCPASRHQCKYCHKIVISVIYVSRRNKNLNTRELQESQRYIN